MTFRIMVAGATGQVARCLAATNLAEGVELQTFGRPALDIADEQSVRRVVAEYGPDIVINAAAYTAVDMAETERDIAAAVNAKGAGYLAEAASSIGAPILHISTDYVFDGSKPAPYIESDPVAPLGAYGQTKYAGELAVADANANHVILRTAWVYSAHGKNFVKTMLRLAESRDEVSVVADQYGSPTYAPDIAATLIAITDLYRADQDALKRGVFHMVGSGEANWAVFAEGIFELSGKRGGPTATVNHISTAEYPTPAARPKNSRLGGTRLKNQYNLSLPSWTDSLALCIDELDQQRKQTS